MGMSGTVQSRRKFLSSMALGAGALWGARREQVYAATGPLAARQPHFAARAKRVIMIFLPGGCSHVDSFDPKVALGRGDKQLKSPWAMKRRGKSGLLTTELFPCIGKSADELCLIRSMHGDHSNHTAATLGMHTGSVSAPRPSLGSWISYALGTENPRLPSHMVLAKEPPYSGSLVWDSNFLPAEHQGVRATPSGNPIRNLRSPDLAHQARVLELLGKLNDNHAELRPDAILSARQTAFETAASMQEAAPVVFDMSGESAATRKLYGMDDAVTADFAWQCLAARRLMEAGVRFVELIDTGSHHNWDGAHGDILTHGELAAKIDRPIHGLLTDLKQRGLLDDTLVVWCTEFGRTPTMEGKQGRNHHAKAFTTWMAGGGVKRGYAHGATDEIGREIVSDGVHTHDFHATILHLLGLDHERLTFPYNGRQFRLTDVAGEVVRPILS